MYLYTIVFRTQQGYFNRTARNLMVTQKIAWWVIMFPYLFSIMCPLSFLMFPYFFKMFPWFSNMMFPHFSHVTSHLFPLKWLDLGDQSPIFRSDDRPGPLFLQGHWQHLGVAQMAQELTLPAGDPCGLWSFHGLWTFMECKSQSITIQCICVHICVYMYMYINIW